MPFRKAIGKSQGATGSGSCSALGQGRFLSLKILFIPIRILKGNLEMGKVG